MELLASSIILVTCLQTNLEFLWKLFLLLVSSNHLFPPVTGICYGAVWLTSHYILYSSALMELSSWWITIALCRQTQLECLSKLLTLIGPIWSLYLAYDYWHLLLGCWRDQSFLSCIPLHLKSVRVLAFLLSPIAILCLYFSMKLWWFLESLRFLHLGSCWILAIFWHA